MQRILAIAWLTWKAALRFKLFLVIALLLLASVVGLPLIIQSDGTAQGFAQIILTYTLSTITALLGLSTLWLSCGTLARDIEECQIQVVATKPVARWQIWLGKWLGIVSLNAALLAITGACVFGLLQWKASKLPPAEQKILRDQVLVARGSAKEQADETAIDNETDSILQRRLKNSQVDSADVPELRKQIREMVTSDYQLVPPDYQRIWKINLGLARYSLAGKPLQIRVKFNTADKSTSGTFVALFQIGDPNSPNVTDLQPYHLAPDTFHEITIPPDMYDANGVLTITYINRNDTAILFSMDDGMEVLYPEGGFGLNFVRGLGIILCWMALLAALGLAAASFLSFPVAAFFALSMLVVVFSSGTLAESLDNPVPTAPGQSANSFSDTVLVPAVKGALSVVDMAKNYSPIDSLSSGRCITWTDLGLAFTQIVLLLGGFFAVVGMVLFSRRELATAQGTQ